MPPLDRKKNHQEFLTEVRDHCNIGRVVLKSLLGRGLVTKGEYKHLLGIVAELEVALLDIDFLWDRKIAQDRVVAYLRGLLKKVQDTEGLWSFELEQAVKEAAEG